MMLLLRRRTAHGMPMDRLGATGAGVEISIVSDSFDALGSAPADETSGAPPTSGDPRLIRAFSAGSEGD